MVLVISDRPWRQKNMMIYINTIIVMFSYFCVFWSMLIQIYYYILYAFIIIRIILLHCMSHLPYSSGLPVNTYGSVSYKTRRLRRTTAVINIVLSNTYDYI